MSLGLGHMVFPSQEVADLSTAPRAPRAAKYMAAMGLWRPTDGSGRSRASANLVLQRLHELSALFSGGSTSSRVVLLHLHSFLGRYGSDDSVLSYDDCSYCGTLIDCWAIAPGYVTFIWDLHYGMPLALLCRQYLVVTYFS